MSVPTDGYVTVTVREGGSWVTKRFDDLDEANEYAAERERRLEREAVREDVAGVGVNDGR